MAPLLGVARPTGREAWTLFGPTARSTSKPPPPMRPIGRSCSIDGPAVFGWHYLSDAGNGPTDTIAEYLRGAVDEGVLEPQPIDPLAHLLSPSGPGRPCTSPTPRIPRRPAERSRLLRALPLGSRDHHRPVRWPAASRLQSSVHSAPWAPNSSEEGR